MTRPLPTDTIHPRTGRIHPLERMTPEQRREDAEQRLRAPRAECAVPGCGRAEPLDEMPRRQTYVGEWEYVCRGCEQKGR